MIGYGNFEGRTERDVLDEFTGYGARGTDGATQLPAGWRILYAGYECESYEGDAFVLLRDAEGNLYSVSGSHCSCMGLENQWDPSPDSWANIERLATNGYGAARAVAQHVLKARAECCMDHEDCLEHPEVGKVCAAARLASADAP
jgi:hypothetical protein